MMERKIIYYPTIIVPSEWAKWAVLYFDKVSSIIPESLDLGEVIKPWNKEDFEIMKILMDEGELERANPQGLFAQVEKRASVEAFKEEFRRILISKRFKSIIIQVPEKN